MFRQKCHPPGKKECFGKNAPPPGKNECFGKKDPLPGKKVSSFKNDPLLRKTVSFFQDDQGHAGSQARDHTHGPGTATPPAPLPPVG